MTISEALKVLGDCRWLKVTPNHVTATRYRSRAELQFLSREELDHPNSLYKAHVLVRRLKGETFEAILVRAAMLVEAGHKPKVRRPPQTGTERCACGSTSQQLVWNEQLKQRVCRRCDNQWTRAARNNDMRPATGEVQ